MYILVFEQAHQDPLMRTSLKAPMERPGPKFYVKRQNNIEAFLYTYIMQLYVCMYVCMYVYMYSWHINYLLVCNIVVEN